MPQIKEEVFRLRLSAQLKSKLEAVAKERGESMSVVARQAIAEFLENCQNRKTMQRVEAALAREGISQEELADEQGEGQG